MEPRRDVFQAIADPTRREILASLIDQPQNVNSLSERFSMTRQAVSLHIKILEECDAILVVKEGRERVCSLKAEKLTEIDTWLNQFREMWKSRFNELDNVLLKLKNKKK